MAADAHPHGDGNATRTSTKSETRKTATGVDVSYGLNASSQMGQIVLLLYSLMLAL
jgi:hypothetical protein